jgi:hypothetical protein
MIGPKRINNPDVLVKYLSWFHACKDTKKAESKKTLGSIFLAFMNNTGHEIKKAHPERAVLWEAG